MRYKKSKFNYFFGFKGDYYVYNTNTSALAQLETEDFEIEDPYVGPLFDNGYIVEQDKDEVKDLIQNINTYANLPKKELDITIILTEMCNFRCVYCYQTKNVHTFSKEDADNLINQANALYEKGIEVLNIHYFGGEPLLNVDMLRYLDIELKKVAESKNKGYRSYITTNGSMLTKDLIKEIGFDTFYLTFDGNRDWQNKLKVSPIDSYENNLKIIEAILSLSQSNINIRLNVCKENQDSFVETIQDIVSVKGYDKERIKFEISPLKKFTANARFEELSPREYAKAHWKLEQALKETGIKLFLPKPFLQPCKYITGNAFCIGPSMKSCYCSSDDTVIHEKVDLAKCICDKRYEHQLPEECLECNVMPLCIHSCGLLKKDGAACIPEKFILKEILCDFLEYPETWKE